MIRLFIVLILSSWMLVSCNPDIKEEVVEKFANGKPQRVEFYIGKGEDKELSGFNRKD